jgi:DNA-binding NarL/FixJ family response regulator
MALAWLQQGETSKAELILSQTQPVEQEPHSLQEHWMRWAWGELRLAQNRPEQALEIANQLIASVVGAVKEAQSIPTLLKLKGEALSALGLPVEARQALEEAKRGAQERGELPFLWQVQSSLGRVYQSLRQYDLAQAEFEQARKVIEALAATINEVELRNHFSVTALATLPKEKQVTGRQLARQEFDGLTRRELQVAELIGQSKSSREIADVLVVSERTIEAHVGNILAKLAFNSRTQVAIWAKEKGLL